MNQRSRISNTAFAFGTLMLSLGSALVAVAQPVSSQPAAPQPAVPQPTVQKPAPLPQQPTWTADPAGEFLPYADAWPDSIMVDGKRGVIRDQGGGVGDEIKGWDQRPIFFGDVVPSVEDRGDAAVWVKAYGKPVDLRFEMRGAYVVTFDLGDKKGFAQTVIGDDAPVQRFKFVSAEVDPLPKPAKTELPEGTIRVVMQRTSFVFYEAFLDNEKNKGVLPHERVRGVALVMPGLFGTPDPVIDVMVRRLRQDRWCVLRMLAQSSRFTESEEFRIDPTQDLEMSGKRVASHLTRRAADCAYAVEAAFEHVLSNRPELVTKPRIALGGSAGAITMATVVAREAEKYAAVVMVGGGADFWLTNYRSNYRRGVDAIRVKWIGRDPTEEEERAMDEAYLRNAPLDSYHTAKALHGKPVYMFYGTLDRAVQTALGDLLWERLGRPQRATVNFGHEMLFASLAWQLTEITQWIAHATEGKGSGQ